MTKEHITYPANASLPYINMRHIDGPFIYMRNGNIKWLSIWDRVLLFFGFTDKYKLEDKYFFHTGLS